MNDAPDFGPWQVNAPDVSHGKYHYRSFRMIDAYRPRMCAHEDRINGGVEVSVEGNAPGTFAHVRGIRGVNGRSAWDVAHEVADAIARGYGWTLAGPTRPDVHEEHEDDAATTTAAEETTT